MPVRCTPNTPVSDLIAVQHESKDQALLLRRIPFRESSLILHLLTRDHGRIALIAKGARRATNRLRPYLTQLAPLAVRWVGGRRGMGTLTDINRGNALLPPTHHLAGLELLSLASKLFRDGDQHGFRESRSALQHLARYQQPEAGWVAASWLLLQQAGVISTLNHCWHCADESSTMHWFDGRYLCPACNPGSRGEAITAELHQLLAGGWHHNNPSVWDAATIHRGTMMIHELQQQIHQQGEQP